MVNQMAKNKFSGNIYRNELAPLGNTPCHQASVCIRRFAPTGFPLHIGIHQVEAGVDPDRRDYSAPHHHVDQDEVNILISDDYLAYRLTFDGEAYEVEAPATIWIPAGVSHSANVIAGRGTFVCLRLAGPNSPPATTKP